MKKGKRKLGLLLTRPLEDTMALARRLRHQGVHHSFDLYLQPLLCIKELPSSTSKTSIEGKDLIFTSRHGVSFFAKQNPCRMNAVWCVGHKTAQEARKHGFKRITIVKENARSLRELLFKRDALTDYIHFSGADVSVDFEKELPSRQCQRILLYESVAAQELRPTIKKAFNQQCIDVVILFSKKTAVTLSSHIDLPQRIHILSLSQTIANVFPTHTSSLFSNDNDMVNKLKTLHEEP